MASIILAGMVPCMGLLVLAWAVFYLLSLVGPRPEPRQ